MTDKPYSQACENNKEFILAVLQDVFCDINSVLEIGSGTGQHAVHFSHNMQHLHWQTADQSEYHEGIHAWIKEHPSPNLHFPLSLTIPSDAWPVHNSNINKPFDAFFTANTAHIMQAEQVQHMMTMINKHLPAKGVFCQYGPFTIDNKFSSQSNADFHAKLIDSGYGGYRDISELCQWAPDLSLSEIKQMPANNLMLIWHKQ